MQILHTLSGPNLGGLEFRVLDQSRWLQEQGHSVAIAAPPGSDTLKLARSWGLATIGMDFSSPYSWSGALTLRQLVKDLRIQVIDAHGTPDAKASALCRDLCSLVRTWHFSRPLRTSWRRRLEWRLGCHRVITTSQGGAQDIVTAGFAGQKRISVVGEWADHGFFADVDKQAIRHAMRQELRLDPAAFVVATIGMLRPDKRQEDLLRVVQVLRQRGVVADVAQQLGTAALEQAQNPQPRNRRTGLGRKAGGQAVADEVAAAALVGGKGHREISHRCNLSMMHPASDRLCRWRQRVAWLISLLNKELLAPVFIGLEA